MQEEESVNLAYLKKAWFHGKMASNSELISKNLNGHISYLFDSLHSLLLKVGVVTFLN